MITNRNTQQQALYEIAMALPLTARKKHENNIKLLQNFLKDKTDFDLFSDKRGKHWADRRILNVEVRGQGSDNMTYEDAAKLVRRSTKQIQMAISIGRGVAHFNVDDEIISIKKVL